MKNLFNQADKQEIINRINTLTPESKRQWGEMDVAQMLKHCTKPLELALTNPKPARNFIGRLIGPMAKNAVFGPKPFKKGSYTPKEFKIVTQEDFEIQKKALLELIDKFKAENITDKVHPFFGKTNDKEWGEGQYKHLDHHLTQFGV